MSGASENFKLLQRAFVEVMNEKAQAALLEYPENPVYSNKHLHAMKRILFGKDKYLHAVSEIRFKKRFIAVLIAAAVLLVGGITVYAKRDVVTAFLNRSMKSFTRIFYQTNQDEETSVPETIEEERIPVYLPDGFVLQEYESSMAHIRIAWKKEEQSIVFEQGTIADIHYLDNEHGEKTILTVDNRTVYVQKTVDEASYLWTDDEYTYLLSCTDTLTFDEVSKMIQSMPKGK